MDERIPHLEDRQFIEDRQFMEHADFLGVDYPSLYMCKAKRGIKREDGGKEAYKLPHRLIEKKRRDRINECIGQLKDLLPEHLKLSTLGHLEKAVVLELTLKHLNALTAVTEQQHQKIVALQNGDRSMKTSIHADLDAFHSGFQACAKEVLQYLSQFENWTAREERCAQLISHLHKVLAQFQPGAPPLQHQLPAGEAHDGQKADGQANCVPVIQRTQGGELNENDTDTDSGYGGEAEKIDGKDKECDRNKAQGPKAVKIKQEFGDDRAAKKPKMTWPGNGLGGTDPTRPDLAFMNSLMGISSVGQQTPICMPFYFINPSAAASYMPFFDKSNIEKYMYPAAALASPFPWLYPAQASAAAAAAAAFPGLSVHFGASPQSNDSHSPDSDELHEADIGSPDEREESPASDEEEDDVADASESKNSPHDQFSVCQTS
ncbi:class E basic helix-loop-helix protein 41 isoform X2 [Pseudochaenichthys georgianus]|uniref:class E basic helix-loop-helix protein 41 isoform X2 n=1 Tax=Pseudochaenichthys georgianus TaxID=52239 RepID=UPI00146BE1E9|nr:class E basic helix-loop-helix protein 41 isoform X2 [Pseudochaenichthys georgianus]